MVQKLLEQQRRQNKQKGGRKVKRGRVRKDAESNGGNTPQQDAAAGGAVGHG